MRSILKLITLGALVSAFSLQPSAFSQGTAFTYQGRLNDGTNPANGSYDLRFAIYDSTNNPGTLIAGPIMIPAIAISNGLFTATLDFGAGAFPGADRWLDIRVRTNNTGSFNPLNPRQRITPAPYALLAGSISGVVPAGSLSGVYTNPVTFNNGANAFTGDGAGLTSLNAGQLGSGTVPDARLASNIARTNQVWLLNGNAGASPTNGNFLGTTDNQPLELRVRGMRVLRLEPDVRAGGGAGNIIGGFTNNYVESPNSAADFIGSGGWINGINVVRSNTSGAFIGAGSANQIGPNLNDSFIGAGYGNMIQEYNSVIGGGRSNLVQQTAEHAFIGGGENNVISSGEQHAVISGGRNNIINGFGDYATIGGGLNNTNGGFQSALAGGWRNWIGDLADHAFIGGGSGNRIVGSYLPTVASVIGGGFFNSIETNGIFSTIGGGYQNRVNAGADGSTIGGGYDNNTGGQYSTIPGGFLNQAYGKYGFAAGQQAHAFHQGSFVWADSQNAGFDSTLNDEFSVRAGGGVRVVTGGAGLTVDGVRVPVPQLTLNDVNHSNIVNVVNGSPVNFVAPGVYAATISGGGAQNYQGVSYTNSVASDIGTISGGVGNTIQTGSAGATISGGSRNQIQTFAPNSVIAGGVDNTIQFASTAGIISGGQNNTLQSGAGYSTIGGGYFNTIQSNAYYVTIGGGVSHLIGSPYATVGGGGGNLIGTNSNSGTISGGYGHIISDNSFDGAIGGGSYATIGMYSDYSTIAGGRGNSIGDHSTSATIAGGFQNTVQTNAGYAAIDGGGENTIGTNASYATIAGGFQNTAGGKYSFAAGRRAKANHDGAFVWADAQDVDFATSKSNQFLVRASGGVGVLTTNPLARLEIQGGADFTGANDGPDIALAWHNGGFRHFIRSRHNSTVTPGNSIDFYINTNSAAGGSSAPGVGNILVLTLDSANGGSVGIGTSSPTNRLDVRGTASATTFITSSDRDAKENLSAVDARAVLEKVAVLPISRWNFKEDAGITHVGPMAQDFYAAFNVGPDNRHIATVDADGVALAAIQGLNQKLEEQRAENADLKRRLEALEQLVRAQKSN